MSRQKNDKNLIILKSIEYSEIKKRKVSKNNDTSGKVTLPKNWIGKKVYVALVEDKK